MHLQSTVRAPRASHGPAGATYWCQLLRERRGKAHQTLPRAGFAAELGLDGEIRSVLWEPDSQPSGFDFVQPEIQSEFLELLCRYLPWMLRRLILRWDAGLCFCLLLTQQSPGEPQKPHCCKRIQPRQREQAATLGARDAFSERRCQTLDQHTTRDAWGSALVPLAHLPEHLRPAESCMAAWETKAAEEAEGAEHRAGFHPLFSNRCIISSKPRAAPERRPTLLQLSPAARWHLSTSTLCDQGHKPRPISWSHCAYETSLSGQFPSGSKLSFFTT